MAHTVVQDKTTDVLEIGCGTGLLSLRIAPFVRSLLAVDAASGMIDALNIKLSKAKEDNTGPDNIETLCIMLEDPEDPRLPPQVSGDGSSGSRRKFDLILSHLVLHHIADLHQLLKTMYGCLKPGGFIALTDFEDFGPEARKFHPESKMDGVERHGINREWFAGLMKDVGFVDIDVKPAWNLTKAVEKFPGEWGNKKPSGDDLTMMDFPFLLCLGRKP